MPDNNGVKIKEVGGSDTGDGDVVVMTVDGGKPDVDSRKAPRREQSEDSNSHDSIVGEVILPTPAPPLIVTASEDSLSHDSIIGETVPPTPKAPLPLIVTASEGSLSHDSIIGETVPPTPKAPLPLIVTASEGKARDDGGPAIRVIPPAALALTVRPTAGPSQARKSPVTVQEWVDSLPPPRMREDNTPEQWPTPRPEGLTREASVQSDAGSHCSSVESLLGSRRPDPEEILLGLGFGGTPNDLDSDVARIPRRFLRPSKVKGVAIDDFLKHQHDLVQTFESGFFGYRGLTGPGYRTPSVIVAKIMEKLRVGKSAPSTPPSSSAGKRFSRVARKVMNVLPSSVLTPDNRMFLDNQGGKSPEVPRKRMIIGKRSFTFDTDGHLIELRKSPSESRARSPSLDDADFVPDLSSTARSFSTDDSTEADSSVPPAPPAPPLSMSSRSASVDSSETPSLPLLSWEVPRQPAASWDTAAKTDFTRSFSRYESIEEMSERGSESTDEPMSALQQRRGSLKRQQHVDEDSSKPEPDVCLQTLDEVETALVVSSLPTVSEVMSSMETLTIQEEVLSTDSSQMELLLNPDGDEEGAEIKKCVSSPHIGLLNFEREGKVEEKEDSVCPNMTAMLKSEKAEEKEEKKSPRKEVVEPLCTRQIRGRAAPLLRVRSDSSGFLDQDVGDCASFEDTRHDRRDLDELVTELKRRGLPATDSRDSAIRMAVTSYSRQLRPAAVADTDLAEARSDIDALRRLRELVAVELRRVADLLDERPVGAGLPIVTEQMTALLRQQTRLRRQLESLSEDSTASSVSSEAPPSTPCCEMLSLVQDGHRHLECLIEHNSRELADIRKLLRDLLASRH